MRIKFIRSGGFVGVQLKYEVNTESLDREEAACWDQLVQEASFFSLPRSMHPVAPGADRFQYVVEITAGRQQHRVETTEESMPDTLQPLVHRLLAAARQKRM
jgi:hypothetical protein